MSLFQAGFLHNCSATEKHFEKNASMSAFLYVYSLPIVPLLRLNADLDLELIFCELHRFQEGAFRWENYLKLIFKVTNSDPGVRTSGFFI